MLVKKWMSQPVITVDVQDSMFDAMGLLKKRGIRTLPVLREGELVGIVTDRDVKRASASDATTLDVHELMYLISSIRVSQIMTPDPVTVPLEYTIEEAAEVLLNHKISGVPVVDVNYKVVGIITQNDIFKVMIALTGIGKRGIQVACQIPDSPGSIKQIADIIRRYGGRMVSILTSYERAPEGFRHVYIRMLSVERNKMEALKKDIMSNSELLYIIDHRENTREVF